MTHVTSAPPLTVAASGPAQERATALQRLLHPLSPTVFLRDYWQQFPVHLTGWTTRCEGIFDRQRLGVALTRQHDAGLLVRVSGDHEGDDGGAGAHQRIDADEVQARFAAGASVCIDPIDRADPQLAAYALSLKHGLGHAGPVTVKCYLSPARYGFNTHFDAHVVTTLQIEGSKRWRVSPTAGVAHPVDNAFLDRDGAVRYIGRPPSSVADWERPPVDPAEFLDVELSPGDVLCLPAGTWHEAKASGGPSLSLNVAFPPADPLSMLVDTVMSELGQQPQWRAGVPAAGAGWGVGVTGVPGQVGAYLAARVDELVTALRAAVTDQSWAATWSQAVQHPRGMAWPDAAATTPAVAGGHGRGLRADRNGSGTRRLQCVLGVADATQAAQWYCQVLGGEVLSAIPEFGWVEVSTPVPGVSLGLTELPTTRPGGGAVLDFGVDDVEAMRAVLGQHGVVVTEPVQEIAGVARFLLAHDPDGNQLMFFQPETLDQGAAADD